MKRQSIKILLLIIFLPLGWTGQAFALGCQGMTDEMALKMASQSDHGSMAAKMGHGCKDCEKSQYQCFKSAEKVAPLAFATKVKVEILKVVQSDPLTIRTIQHQIRGPDIKPKVFPILPITPVSRHTRRQV